MSLFLRRSKSNLYCYKGVSVFVLDACGNQLRSVIHRTGPALYFRTNTAGPLYGPYKTTPLHQTTPATALDGPSLEELDKEAQEIPSVPIKSGTKQANFEQNVLRGLKALTSAYDFVTLPLYAAVQQPWKKLALHNSEKATLVDPSKMIYKTVVPKSPLHQEMDDLHTNTISRLFIHAVAKHGHKKSLGVREVLGEEEMLDPVSGKNMRKLILGDYKWKTYTQVGETVDQLSRGFELLNLAKNEKVAIFAETREEWFMIAMSCFKRNLPSR